MNREDKVEQPILEILSRRALLRDHLFPDKDRYRVCLSDGSCSISALLIIDPCDFSYVIKVKNYAISQFYTRRSGIEDLHIFDPVFLHNVVIVRDNMRSQSPVDFHYKPLQEQNAINSASRDAMTLFQMQVLADAKIITPISSLILGNNQCEWIIQAKITQKSNISNCGQRFFSFDIFDGSGVIRCFAFEEFVDYYYDYVEVDNVYFITKGQLRRAKNKKFCRRNCQDCFGYNMTITWQTVIEGCTIDKFQLLGQTYNFTLFEIIEEMDVGNIVDLIGICTQAVDVRTFTSRSTNRRHKKREIYLLDETKTYLTLTLWDEQAEAFDGSHKPIIAVKGARVEKSNNHREKRIAVVLSSLLERNPVIAEAFMIRDWYNAEGRDFERFHNRYIEDSFVPFLSRG